MGVKGNTYRKTALLDMFERVRGAGGERKGGERERDQTKQKHGQIKD